MVRPMLMRNILSFLSAANVIKLKTLRVYIVTKHMSYIIMKKTPTVIIRWLGVVSGRSI